MQIQLFNLNYLKIKNFSVSNFYPIHHFERKNLERKILSVIKLLLISSFSNNTGMIQTFSKAIQLVIEKMKYLRSKLSSI